MRRLALVVVVGSGCGASPKPAPPAKPAPVENQPAPAATVDDGYGGLLDEPGMNGCFGYGRSGFGPGGGGCSHGDPPPPAGKPAMDLGKPTASASSLDVQTLRHVLKGSASRLQYCYEKQLLTDTQLAGTVQVRFTIAVDGSVSSAHADGLGDDDVEGCVEATLREAEFPMPTDGKPLDVELSITYRQI